MVKDRGGDIDIHFGDRRLERDCSSDVRGQRRFGQAWPALRRRLGILAAAPTLAALRGAPGRCHELTGNLAGSLAVTITANYRLIFRPDHDPLPVTGDGGLSWGEVTRVTVEEVADYHGN